MTSQGEGLTRELPQWPERPDDAIKFHDEYFSIIGHDTCLAYERARAEAALARLKVAAEALRIIASRPTCQVYGACEDGQVDAADALALIGKVPE